MKRIKTNKRAHLKKYGQEVKDYPEKMVKVNS
jgi:hypothetical protein